MGGDNKQDELREMLEETWEDRARVRSIVTLHVIGNGRYVMSSTSNTIFFAPRC